MKKKHSAILALLLLAAFVCTVLSVSGCSAEAQSSPGPEAPNTPDAMAPCIIYEGERYFTTGREMPAEVDQSAIVGHITAVVPYNRLPEKEGETNFGAVGDPYAITEDGLLVMHCGEWTLFQTVEE